MSTQNKAYLFALSAVLLWSTVATAFKLTLSYLTPAQLVLLSSIASAVVLGLILGLQGKLAQLKYLTKKDWQASIVFGAINPTIYYLVLFQAYALLPAQEAQAINYSWAITMTLLAIPLLKQRLRWQDLAAAAFCYGGVLVIATHGHLMELKFSSTLGVILALASTVLWALYWILNTRDQRDPIIGLFLNFACAIPMIFIYCLITGELKPMAWQGIMGSIYIGIFEMGLTFVLWLSAMKYTQSTAKISNLIFISPFLSLVFIYFLLGEKILPSTFIGLGLIISGLILQQWRAKPR
ncbi:DMT family transporter [Thiofilum flexile]|uniref:DMT family transporter n=1 Tax=Thiofilum flexile TaxID=125627 RepID=UPI00036CAC38|nr:DMT family transporter [Thiofilum flexile]